MTLIEVAVGLVVWSFALSAVLCALSRRIAPRFGLVDRPGGRKAHARPTPLGGGIAIWLTVGITLLLGALAATVAGDALPAALARHVGGLIEKRREMTGLFAAATLVMLVGLCDDLGGLSWKLRLLAQAGLAAVVAASGARISLFYAFADPWVTGALTVLWIVGLTNAFNFLDNMDGLAAGVGLIAALLFAGAQIAVGGLFVPAVLLIFVGALGGFLLHNSRPARLFMGDAGSNFLGFSLGILTVIGTFTREPYSKYSVLTPLLVMAVPLYDMISVIFIRLREGRSPFQADRRHFSHRLVERGLTPSRAVWTIDLVTLAGGLGALSLHRPGLRGFEAGLIVAQTVCLLGVVALLEISTPRPERPDGSPKAEDFRSSSSTDSRAENDRAATS